jgi:hypothetical protein
VPGEENAGHTWLRAPGKKGIAIMPNMAPTATGRNNDLTEAQLIKTINAHIAKGEQHYISAGLHLAKLKERCPDQVTFLALVKDKIGIGKSRTYELLQIADGRKTVEQVRVDTAERQEKYRLSVSNGQNRDDCRHAIADSGFDEEGAPIWICRGCDLGAPRSCGCHPCTATGRSAS